MNTEIKNTGNSSGANTILIVIVIILLLLGGFALWYRNYQTPVEKSGTNFDVNLNLGGSDGGGAPQVEGTTP